MTSHSETLDPTVVETIGTRDIELNVAKKDSNDTIVFDSTPDLDITYTVKAVAADGAAVGFDPYELKNFEKVAEEYQPDLTITTKAYDVTNKEQRVELTAEDDFYKYVKLPEVQTVDYKTWLASKDNGYDVKLTFAWSDTYGNPQEYVDSELAAKSATEQRTFIEGVIAALKNVQFEFVFEVKGVEGEDVPPVTKYAVTYTNEGTNGTITVTNEAGNVTSGATVEENTKITVKVTANEGFKIDTVTVGEEVETVGNTTFEKEYTVTSDLTISAVYSENIAEPEYEVFQTGKLGLYQQELKKAYYFDGTITNGRFLGTIDIFEDAVEFTSYKSNDNYYLKFVDAQGTDKYLAAGLNSDNNTAFSIQDEPFIWSYNEEYDTYVAAIDTKGDYYIGTYGNFNTFSLSGTYRFGEEGNYIASIVSEEIIVKATDITIEANSYEVQEGLTTTLKSTLVPSYAPGEVVYEVVPNSGEGEVRIDGNVVTGVKVGTVQIVGKIDGIESKPITITVTPKSDTPVSVQYTYTFDGLPSGMTTSAGNVTLGEANWNYDESVHIGYQGTYKGLQIGKGGTAQSNPRKISTKLPDGAIVTSYNVKVNAGGKGHCKISFDATGETAVKETDFAKVDQGTFTNITESEVEYNASYFTITLNALDTKAIYLNSISFTYYVA